MLLLAPFASKLVNNLWHSESQHLKEFRNWRHFPSITAFCRFSNIFQRLTVPRICDQFGCKRCPKKHRDVNYKLLYEFFKISLFCLNGRLSKIRSVHTYVITRTVHFYLIGIIMKYLFDNVLCCFAIYFRAQYCKPAFYVFWFCCK